MSEELKPCEHGRNFCMDCHYPKGKFKTLPAMYDGLAAENQRLRTELAALKAGQGEAITEVSAETFSSDGTSDIITCNLPIGTKLYLSAPPASADAVPVSRYQLTRALDQLNRLGFGGVSYVRELRALLAQSELKVKP